MIGPMALTWPPFRLVCNWLKQRYYPMLGFGAFHSAQRFCQLFEEVRQWLRPQQWLGEKVSLAQRREHVVKRVAELRSLFASA